MNVFGLDIAHIVELGTHVAQAGAMRAAELAADDMFDFVIGVVILVYEQDPDG